MEHILPIFLQEESFAGNNLWKGVTLFNAVCWGSSFISTKAAKRAMSSKFKMYSAPCAAMDRLGSEA